MSKDKIEVNMNVYDIPIVVEALEEANEEIERLNNKVEELMTLYTTERNVKEELQDRIDKAIEYMDNLKIEDFSIRSQYGYLLVDYNRLVSILMGKPRFTNEKENN